MKTGMNLLLWTTNVTAELFPLFAKLKATGYDGVEIPLFEGDAAYYKTIAAELKKQGLGCTTVTCIGPEANPISPDAAIRKAAVERHKWAIEMSSDSRRPTCWPARFTRRSRSSPVSRRRRTKRRAVSRCCGNRQSLPSSTR